MWENRDFEVFSRDSVRGKAALCLCVSVSLCLCPHPHTLNSEVYSGSVSGGCIGRVSYPKKACIFSGSPTYIGESPIDILRSMVRSSGRAAAPPRAILYLYLFLYLCQELCGVMPASQKLIFKGKARQDAETVAAAGMVCGDKLMLMLSPEGVKEMKQVEERLAGEKRKQEAVEAQQMKEQHRDGTDMDSSEQVAATAKATVIEEDGAGEVGAQVVTVIHLKLRYRMVVQFASALTFLDLKEKLAKLCHVPAKHQRIIFKAKERESAQLLSAAGVKSGDKMMLLLAEGEWKVRDEKELISEVESELCLVQDKISKLKSRCEHGLFGNDTTEISIQAGICLEVVSFSLSCTLICPAVCPFTRARVRSLALSLTHNPANSRYLSLKPQNKRDCQGSAGCEFGCMDASLPLYIESPSIPRAYPCVTTHTNAPLARARRQRLVLPPQDFNRKKPPPPEGLPIVL